MKSKVFQFHAVVLLLSCLLCPFTAIAQPGPIQSYVVPLQGGTVALPRYTPFSMGYFPYHNGVPNDSIKYIIGSQMVEGTASTADRIIDVTGGGAYAYRNNSGVWSGSLNRLLHNSMLMVMNRHEARSLVLEGFPKDTMTYLMPMPNGRTRFLSPRLHHDHPIDSVGLVWSGFHKTHSMRGGGDLIIDMSTRQIARRDSTEGWMGTMTHVRVGQPVMIQVNHTQTFDWTYYPDRE